MSKQFRMGRAANVLLIAAALAPGRPIGMVEKPPKVEEPVEPSHISLDRIERAERRRQERRLKRLRRR